MFSTANVRRKKLYKKKLNLNYDKRKVFFLLYANCMGIFNWISKKTGKEKTGTGRTGSLCAKGLLITVPIFWLPPMRWRSHNSRWNVRFRKSSPTFYFLQHCCLYTYLLIKLNFQFKIFFLINSDFFCLFIFFLLFYFVNLKQTYFSFCVKFEFNINNFVFMLFS